MRSDPTPTLTAGARRRRWLVVATALAVTAVAASQLAFLCDDAFITFRYVSNAHDGRGLVWNPAPFRPVEGYTGFLWALLLWATWIWFGVEPPAAANVLSMLCGLGAVVVTAAAAGRIRQRDGATLGTTGIACTLAAVVGNRTFLQWLTGGLETALFDLVFLGWVVLAFRTEARRGTAWLAAWSAVAAGAALTRPDGLLLVATTVAIAGLTARRLGTRSLLLGLLPLLSVAAHLLWRRTFYGDWLPNTYYAKVTAPWPESGARYLACFAFENGLWLWLLLALAWLARELRGGAACRALLLGNLPAVAAVAATTFHVAYYVLRVGGDHFEYRILSHLIPLLALSATAMAARLARGPRLPGAAALLLALAAVPGWLHLAATTPRTVPPFARLEPQAPGLLRPIARWFDRQQAWLQVQFVCHRRDQHEWFLRTSTTTLPERSRTAYDLADIPVVETLAAGRIGWVLPDCAVLDVLGLNDWVAARTTVADQNGRFLPRDLVLATLADADADGDGVRTAAELRTSWAAHAGALAALGPEIVELLLLLFADERADALTATEAQAIAPFLAGLRFMAHERQAPADYVQALDPNVTIVDRAAVVRPRAVPLSADRVRAIEARWRQRLGG